MNLLNSDNKTYAIKIKNKLYAFCKSNQVKNRTVSGKDVLVVMAVLH
jgi:hypothetical protein